MRRSGQTSRAAARVARTSTGWWPESSTTGTPPASPFPWKRPPTPAVPLRKDGDPVRHPGSDDLVRPVIRMAGEPVGDEGLLHGGDQLLDVGVIDAQDREPVEGNLVDEVGERLLDLADPRVEVEGLRG